MRPTQTERIREFIDSDGGAAALRLALALLGFALCLLSPQRRAAAGHALSAAIALVLPLAFLAAVFRPAAIVCYLGAMLGLRCIRFLDWALFSLPRGAMRGRLGSVRAFAFAVAMEFGAAGAGASFIASCFRAHAPARLGPAVVRRIARERHSHPRRATCQKAEKCSLIKHNPGLERMPLHVFPPRRFALPQPTADHRSGK